MSYWVRIVIPHFKYEILALEDETRYIDLPAIAASQDAD